jgi:hypothetical protein
MNELEEKKREIKESLSDSKKQTVLLESIEEKLTQIESNTKPIPFMNERQKRENRINGVMMILIALFGAYVSVAVGLVPQEMAKEKLNGLFDIAFWWMTKGD